VLSILCPNGTKVKIPRLDMNEAHHMLGVRLAPDGNNEAEFYHLCKETLKWKQHMLTANLSWAVVDFGIRQVLMPKL